MAEEQQRLVRVRRKLTERFILLAATRGRLHVRSVDDPAAYHLAVATRLAPEYVTEAA